MKKSQDKQAQIEAKILQEQEEIKLFYALKNSKTTARKKKTALKKAVKLKSESDLEICKK